MSLGLVLSRISITVAAGIDSNHTFIQFFSNKVDAGGFFLFFWKGIFVNIFTTELINSLCRLVYDFFHTFDPLGSLRSVKCSLSIEQKRRKDARVPEWRWASISKDASGIITLDMPNDAPIKGLVTWPPTCGLCKKAVPSIALRNGHIY